MFFYKPKAQYNFLNDIDSDVFNLFQVVLNQKEKFLETLKIMPIHTDLFKYYMENQETYPIKKAIRFIFLSNVSYLGKMNTLQLGCNKPLKGIIKNLDKTQKLLKHCKFTNFDFSKMINSLSFINDEKNKVFIYCDPPYLTTVNNYSDRFNEEKSLELFDVLENSGCKFAYSEFDHPFILSEANKRGLNINIIGERRALKNRRIEILITNFKIIQQVLF